MPNTQKQNKIADLILEELLVCFEQVLRSLMCAGHGTTYKGNEFILLKARRLKLTSQA